MDTPVVHPQRSEVRTLVLFFVLATVMAWTLWFAGSAAVSALGPGIASIAFLPGTFAPAAAAILLTRNGGELTSTSPLAAGLTRWRVPLRWYVFALVFMPSVKLTAAIVHRVDLGVWPAFGATPIGVMLIATAFSTPFQIGEELGWRGYALPRLSSLVGLPAASLILGLIWAVWHLPLFLLPGADLTGQPLAVFVVAVTAVSVAMAWLHAGTGASLLLVMLMHAAINNTTGVVPAADAEPRGVFTLAASPMAWYTALVLAAAAAILLTRLRPGTIDERTALR